MNEKRKKEINNMADAIESVGQTIDRELGTISDRNKPFPSGEVSEDIIRKKISPADKIIATKALEIPKCLAIPVNGRIYCVEIKGSELKSPGGLILPVKLSQKKNDDVDDWPRFFVVKWDENGIPKEIRDKLSVAVEVFPFMPEEAIGYMFPRVVDWNTGNIFKSLHYTELAGISTVKPEVVEK